MHLLCVHPLTHVCIFQVLLTSLCSQVSLHRQHSGQDPGEATFKRALSQRQLSKLQEEWDKEIPKVSLFRVMRLNAKEWWIIVVGELSPPFLVSSLKKACHNTCAFNTVYTCMPCVCIQVCVRKYTLLSAY